MMQALFSCAGRFTRVQYFFWAIVEMVAVAGSIAVLTLVFGMTLAKALDIHGVSLQTEWLRLLIMSAVLGGICVWPSIALMVKRLRDIGVPPWICLFGLVAFHIFDSMVLSKYLPTLRNGTTIVGAAAGWIVLLVLLFTPSAGRVKLRGLAALEAERARRREEARLKLEEELFLRMQEQEALTAQHAHQLGAAPVVAASPVIVPSHQFGRRYGA